MKVLGLTLTNVDLVMPEPEPVTVAKGRQCSDWPGLSQVEGVIPFLARRLRVGNGGPRGKSRLCPRCREQVESALTTAVKTVKGGGALIEATRAAVGAPSRSTSEQIFP